ncbi:hypothetical protein CsSME_00026924 [Camellia sinensis var. sinensis]
MELLQTKEAAELHQEVAAYDLSSTYTKAMFNAQMPMGRKRLARLLCSRTCFVYLVICMTSLICMSCIKSNNNPRL